MNDAIHIEPFFLDSPRGPLFCLYHAPSQAVASAGVLYLHPFAEEMHKSRRMAALQARALASAGYAVLQIDFTGCGDSAGDFGDASWENWRNDALLAHAWLNARVNGPITLWGLRLGASLAVDVAQQLTGIARLLLWQPVVNGDQFLTQFLRIKLASEMLNEGQAQSGTKELRSRLEAGESTEICGYLLSPAMARGLRDFKLADKHPPCTVDWIEVGDAESEDVLPTHRGVVDAWRLAEVPVHTHTVAGAAFWATQEITECPALLFLTSQVMSQ